MGQVLVTGGAGFIGSHLVRAILTRGDNVRVLDDFSSGSKANLDGVDVELVVEDVRNEAAVKRAVEGVDTVFHLAAFVSVPASMENPTKCYDTNVMGSLKILRAAQETGVRRVVLASSAAIYGESESPVAENHPLNPQSPYAASKLAMEQAAKLFSQSFNLETVCLRFFNVYGPRQSPDSPYAAAIPKFIQVMLAGEPATIHGDGKQTRDFVFIEDVVQGILKASEVEDVAGKVFNLSGGKSISILELVDILHRFFPEAKEPKHSPAREGYIRFSQADITRAIEALGYRPEVAVEEGLGITVKWFRANR